MVLGDPGEGDDSQYQVLRPLRATSKDTDFTFIVSDVIYPAGDVADYHDKFYWPYRGLPGPDLRHPGNHDWYDGLHGFMTLLCGADPDLRPPVQREQEPLAARLPRSRLAQADGGAAGGDRGDAGPPAASRPDSRRPTSPSS